MAGRFAFTPQPREGQFTGERDGHQYGCRSVRGQKNSILHKAIKCGRLREAFKTNNVRYNAIPVEWGYRWCENCGGDE